MNLQKLLTEYFESNKLMQLATVADGQPWLCNVHFVNDDQNNIYWTSAKKRRHSKEILQNPNTAATIVRSPDKKQALQITGQSSELPLEQVPAINQLYGEKFGHKPSRLEEALANTLDGRAYWILKPDTIHFWDELHFPDNPKQEFKI